MIALNTAAIVSYVGNGSADEFAITFPTFEAANIVAEVVDGDGVITPLVIDTDYTLSDIGIPNTDASLTLVDASQDWLDGDGDLITGYTLNIKFSTEASQPSKFRDLGRFAPEVFEKNMDRLTMHMLALRGQADTSTDDVTSLEGRMDTAEDDIDTLQSQVATLQGEMVTAQSEINTLQSEMVTAQSEINTLQAEVQVLQESLSLAPIVETKIANFTAAYNYIYLTTGALSIQLPAPVANGSFYIKKKDASTLTLVRNSGEKIEEVAASRTLTSTRESARVVSDGTDWFLI